MYTAPLQSVAESASDIDCFWYVGHERFSNSAAGDTIQEWKVYGEIFHRKSAFDKSSSNGLPLLSLALVSEGLNTCAVELIPEFRRAILENSWACSLFKRSIRKFHSEWHFFVHNRCHAIFIESVRQNPVLTSTSNKQQQDRVTESQASESNCCCACQMFADRDVEIHI